MKKENAYLVGRLVKTHGLNGELGASFEVDDPEIYLHSDVIYLSTPTGLVPYFIDSQQLLNNKGILKFEDIDHIDEAKELLGAELYIPLGDLPELDEGQIYYHELVGFQVVDDDLGELGEVSNVYDFQSHAVMEMLYKEAEVLIPLNEELIQNVDPDKEIIYLSLPPGLIDVYME